MTNRKKIYRKSRYDILLNKPGRIVYIMPPPPPGLPREVFLGTQGATGVYSGMTGIQGTTRLYGGITGYVGMTGGQGSTGTGRVPVAEETFRAASRRSFLNRIREMLRQV